MYAINRSSSAVFPADPRVVSSARSGEAIEFDVPVLDGGVKMADVYLPRPGYGSVHDSVADIVGGNVSYYYDAQIMVPFFSQLFSRPREFTRYDYIDPMGTYKPHYANRVETIRHPLSWMRDSQFHRQDLLSANVWRRNQTEPLLFI